MTELVLYEHVSLDVLRHADRLLRLVGWLLLEVSANEQTGYVRIIAEARDPRSREGIKVTLLRSSHDGDVVEMRDRVVLVDAMYTNEWVVADNLGQRRHHSLNTAALELLVYACDNGPAGALADGDAAARRVLSDLITALEEPRG